MLHVSCSKFSQLSNSEKIENLSYFFGPLCRPNDIQTLLTTTYVISVCAFFLICKKALSCGTTRARQRHVLLAQKQ